jgi:superfamily II DNA/RNA helicase
MPEELGGTCLHMVGGTSIKRLMKTYSKSCPFILIGTPGRVAEMSYKTNLPIFLIPILVLDEVDLLLESSYLKDMKIIINNTGKKLKGGRQTVLSSATVTNRTKSIFIGYKWCRKSVLMSLIHIKSVLSNLPTNLLHWTIKLDNESPIGELDRCLSALEAYHTLVFINNLQRIAEIIKNHRALKIKVVTLHGSLDTRDRKATINLFRVGKSQTLLVSDTIARGLDFPNCKLVINVEIPSSLAQYIHRAGRAGRANKEGTVITFYKKDQEHVIKAWEKELNITFDEVKFQNGEILTIQEYIDRSTTFG